MGENYSHETSKPAYEDNEDGKRKQENEILAIMESLGGRACLLQLAEIVNLPQSTVSGRMSDLREHDKAFDTGETIVYAGRKRKLFAVLKPEKILTEKAKEIEVPKDKLDKAQDVLPLVDRNNQINLPFNER